MDPPNVIAYRFVDGRDSLPRPSVVEGLNTTPSVGEPEMEEFVIENPTLVQNPAL